MSEKLVSRIFALLFIAITALSINLSLGYAQASSSEQVLPRGTVFLLRGYQVLTMNVFIPEQPNVQLLTTNLRLEAFDPAQRDGWRILSADIPKTGNFLYTLEGSGRTERQLPTATQLVRTDLITGERVILSNRNGIYGFVLSPDQQHMIVGYHDGEFGVAQQYSCILDLQTLECRDVPMIATSNLGFWLDNQRYLGFGVSPFGLVIVSTDTGIPQPLPVAAEWFVYSAVPIPNTRTLLLSARLRSDTARNASQFLTLDVDTHALQNFTYDAANENYALVETWSFSPDGHYLLYGGLRRVLVEFQTGRQIQEFDTVFNSGWVNNNTLVVQGALNATTNGILRTDANTGNTVQIRTSSEAYGILIVP